MPPDLCTLLITGLLASGSANQPPDAASMEMLEFLGGFETKNGNWLDPLTLDDGERKSTKPAREDKQHE